MARIMAGGQEFDSDLVAFDKDGTLIAFDVMWGRLAEAWVEAVAGDDQALAEDLYHSLGYDRGRRRTLPQSPLSIATTGQLQALVAGGLYRHGLSWPEAEDRTRLAFQKAEQDLPLTDLVHSAGDVGGLFARLRAAGIRLAVVTTDHRAETQETMRLLGIEELVDLLVCGDDGLPSKPAPDMLLAACEGLGIEPGRTVVVGDTLGDLLMAQRAGAGLRVAVLTGAGDPQMLARDADVVLQSIDGIDVAVDDPL
jgi:HAD superfamily hydrolase (TIGR01509 family)